jgi:hypothetical protein
VRDIYNRLNAIWSEYQNDREALINNIGDFIRTHPNRIIKNYHKENDNEERVKPNKPEEYKKVKSGGKKAASNRNKEI